MGLTKKSATKTSVKATSNQHGSQALPKVVGRNDISRAHPAGMKGDKMGPQMTLKSTTKISKPVANTTSLFNRLKNKKMFGE